MVLDQKEEQDIESSNLILKANTEHRENVTLQRSEEFTAACRAICHSVSQDKHHQASINQGLSITLLFHLCTVHVSLNISSIVSCVYMALDTTSNVRVKARLGVLWA